MVRVHVFLAATTNSFMVFGNMVPVSLGVTLTGDGMHVGIMPVTRHVAGRNNRRPETGNHGQNNQQYRECWLFSVHISWSVKVPKGSMVYTVVRARK